MIEEDKINKNTEKTEESAKEEEKKGEVYYKMAELAVNEKEREGEKKLNSQKRSWWGLIILAGVLVLTVAGMVIYNNWRAKKQVEFQEEQQELSLPITSGQVVKDFENREKVIKAEAVPPEDFRQKYMEAINRSLAAIENNKPSEEGAADLKDDYFNVAVSYGILGEYGKAEEYYFLLLEKWPDDYKSKLNLGDLYILMGQAQAAAVKFYETVEEYPEDYRTYGKLADLYVKYSTASDNLQKAGMIYEAGAANAVYKRTLYKDYAFFAENYLKDYEKALWATREYQKIMGSTEEQEIERLEGLIERE